MSTQDTIKNTRDNKKRIKKVNKSSQHPDLIESKRYLLVDPEGIRHIIFHESGYNVLDVFLGYYIYKSSGKTFITLVPGLYDATRSRSIDRF